jgi:hypothetical protein
MDRQPAVRLLLVARLRILIELIMQGYMKYIVVINIPYPIKVILEM